MLNKIKKHKFLLIIILFLFISLFINKKVDAISTSAGEFPSFPSNFNDTTHDIVIINHGSWTSNNHYMAFPKNKGYFCYENGLIVFKNTSSSTVSGYRGDVLSTSWKTKYTASATANNTYSWSEMGVDTNQPGNYDTDGKRHIIYANTDIYNTDGSIYFYNTIKPQYSINISTTEETFNKIIVYSNWFSLTDLSKYEVYVSTDTINWDKMHYETLTDAETGTTNFRYYWDIYQNGYYYFKFLNTKTNEEEYITYTITNIGYDIYFSTEETDKPIRCYSNTFKFDTMWVYISEDGVNWSSMNSEYVEYNVGDIENSTERFWYYITKNGTYYFKFVQCSADGGIGDTFYITKEINNLIINDYMSDDYVPIPNLYMDFDEEEQAFIIQTQNLILDKALNMKCYYTSDLENNEVYTWNEMDIEFCTNNYTHSINDNNEAYFYLKIPLVRC